MEYSGAKYNDKVVKLRGDNMAEKIITVEVDKNGNFSVDAAGFQGKGCKAMTEAFASMGTLKNEELKPEYYHEGPGGHGVALGRG